MTKKIEPSSDAAVLAEALEGVRPLTGASRVPRAPSLKAGPPSAAGPRPSFEIIEEDEALMGWRRGLDRRVVKKLQSGDPTPTVRIDLHGRTEKEAQADLDAFLAQAAAGKIRSVLVIHGRGHHSPGGVPVLKAEVPRWLTSGREADRVLCFATAQPRDGGEGALYVLLRK